MVTKAHHAAWKRAWLKKNRQHVLAKKRERLAFKRSLKNTPCVDCGKQLPAIAMEFDHLRDKRCKVSQNGSYSKRYILDEVAKCEVVCILCHRDRTHSRYAFSQSKTAVAKRVLQAKVNELKAAPCGICGNSYDPWKMDFDHVDPKQKCEKISNMVRRRARFTSILNEIAKCRLLCALCHRLWSDEQSHGTQEK